MGTEANLRKGFSLGNWEVLPDRSLIRDGSNEVRVEPLPMNVLVALAENPGEVLTKDDLVDRVWGGRAIADGPILRAISQLRRALGDDRSEPTYIENIPRIGYRLLVPVVPHESRPADAEPAPAPTLPVNLMLGIVVLVAVAALGWFFSCSLFRVGCPAPTPSLAVHRFECTSATAEHFCRGFSEELVSSLLESGRVKIVKLRVPIPSPPCDEQYRVDWTVGGSVQQLNGVIKASAEIVNCADGTVRRQINEQAPEIGLFGLQKRVAGLISESLLPQDPPPIELASEPQNDDAYILYVQGRAQLEQRSRFAIERSIESFMQSIELDPGYGPAHLQLAHAYLLMPEYNAELDTRDYYARAEQAIARGIDADDAIRDAAATVTGFIAHKRRNWIAASAAFEQATGSDVVRAQAHNWYSRFLATTGQTNMALRQAQQAYTSAPDSPTIVSRLAIVHLWLGDLEAAGRYFELASSFEPELPLHHLAYSMYLIETGDFGGARAAAKTGLEHFGYDTSWVDPVFDGLQDPSRRDAAIRRIASLEDGGALSKYVILALWAEFGEADRAIETANGILANIEGQDAEMGLEILFSSQLLPLVHDHPGFPGLLERAGLNAYWAHIGCAWDDGRLHCE